MKRIILFCLIALIAVFITSCSSSPKDIVSPTKGTALVNSATSGGRTSCGWVQLWAGGPKFAEFNVGSSINDYSTVTATTNADKFTTDNIGGYYQWGGITNKDSVANYSNATSDISGTGTPGTSTVGDTARLLWGSNWKMPTKENIYNLMNKDENGTDLTTALTTWEWCDGSNKQYVSGCTLAGYKVSGVGTYANNSIFLPMAGYFDINYGGTVHSVGSLGKYWSSTPGDNNKTYYLHLNSSSQSMINYDRYEADSVRAILTE